MGAESRLFEATVGLLTGWSADEEERFTAFFVVVDGALTFEVFEGLGFDVTVDQSSASVARRPCTGDSLLSEM